MAVVRLIFRPCVGNHPMGVRFAARNHPTAVRFVARNHPSVCVADSSPQRGAKHDLRQDIGSPGGELDAKRPEGWFHAR